MRRLLILHCGPMKTGSTVIQDTLRFHRQSLLSLGISFYHVRAKSLQSDLGKIISEEELLGNRIVLLSSEFFCQKSPFLLKKDMIFFLKDMVPTLIRIPMNQPIIILS